MHMLGANMILASRAISFSPFTQDTGLMSIIHGLAPLCSMARNVITILFLFTKSDIKTILIPVVSVYSDASWFYASAENHQWSLDNLFCPLTT